MDYKHPITGTPMKIRVVKLPTRSPKFNPIELLWALLVKDFKNAANLYIVPMKKPQDITAKFATHIMSCFTHNDA
eukprot:7376493-Ditylum_brightwellii.AAC.1